MTARERREILVRAINTYGKSAQLDMVVEEMAELTKAISKLRRAGSDDETRAAMENIAEEAADVQIMLDQLRMMFGIVTAPIEEEKLIRLAGRLDHYEKSPLVVALDGEKLMLLSQHEVGLPSPSGCWWRRSSTAMTNYKGGEHHE